MPLTMPSMAWSIGASSKTMFAALPPSSRVSFLSVPATERAMARPTAVDPVNATLLTSAWLTSACPVSPAPVMMLTTPGGRSACCRISENSSAVSGVVEARVIELVGPAGVVEEPSGDEGYVYVAALLDRLSVVEALGHGQFAGAFLNEAGNAEQVLAAVAAGEPGPGAHVGAAC